MGVDLVPSLQNGADLVAGDGVHAAAEGHHLHQVQALVAAVGHELGRRVQPGVIGPLVQHVGGEFGLQLADGVLRDQHGPALTDELVNAVVDLRVQVVGPAGEHDHRQVLLLGQGQVLLALLVDALHVGVVLLIGGVGSGFHFLLRDGAEVLGQDVGHLAGEVLAPVEAHIVVDKLHVLQGGDVGVQHLGIIGHHRAVVMVVPQVLIQVVAHAGVEDGVGLLVQQGLDVAVHQLGRVAYGIRGDGVLAPEVELAVAFRGVEHPKAQLGEEGVPEGVQLEHVQAHGDADGAPGAGAGLVGVQKLPLVVVHVVLGGGALLFQGLVAAVARDVPGAVREGVHRQAAVVFAAVAGDGPYLMGEGSKLLRPDDGAVAPALLLGVEGRAVGAHQPGDGGPDDVLANLLLKGPQHRVVEERAALHHNVVAQAAGVHHPDNLVQGVFHHAGGKARGDILNGGAVLLGLLYGGVHKHRAAGAQVHGAVGKEAQLGEIRHLIAQGPGKGLQKAAAAGGARLV